MGRWVLINIFLLKWKCLEGGVFVYMMAHHVGMVSELITTMFLTVDPLDSHSTVTYL